MSLDILWDYSTILELELWKNKVRSKNNSNNWDLELVEYSAVGRNKPEITIGGLVQLLLLNHSGGNKIQLLSVVIALKAYSWG